MILDAQNLHTFSQSRQTPGLQPYIASVPRPSPLRIIVRVFKIGKAWDETSREGCMTRSARPVDLAVTI